jgi:hypothetical protein
MPQGTLSASGPSLAWRPFTLKGAKVTKEKIANRLL